MAQLTWTFDAPTGVYKNNAMSSRIRDAAIAETVFMQFVTPETGYGKKRGESISITRISNIDPTVSGLLTEGQKISETEMSLSVVAITVQEWGQAVPYTSLYEDLGAVNLDNAIQKQLKKQMSLIMDRAAANAFKQSPVKAIPTGIAETTFDTDGTPSFQAIVNLNVSHVEAIRDYMYSTLLVPAYENGDYMAIVSTKAKRGIMNDPKFEEWNKYTTPEKKFNSEIGRLEGIRFMESNNSLALSQSLGLNGVLGEAVFFGDDAVAMAIAQEPELRAKPIEDYGRSKGVAWYGILAYGLVWASANPGEGKVVHVTSS